MFTPLVIVTLVGCGLNAGLFFVFSNTIMRSLSQMPHAQGMLAMQLINRVIQNPAFFAVFLGTGLLSLIVIGFAALEYPRGAVYAIVGGAVYLVGSIVITIAFNVPLNNRLEALSHETDDGREMWALYLDRWTQWNHIRTLACTAATVLLALALTA